MRAIIISAVSSLLIGSGVGKALQFSPAVFDTPVEPAELSLDTDDPNLAAYKTLVAQEGVTVGPVTYYAPTRIDYPYAEDDGSDVAYLEASAEETRRQLAALEADMERDSAPRVETAAFQLAAAPAVPNSAPTRWSGRLGLSEQVAPAARELALEADVSAPEAATADTEPDFE